jgi:hypothetical protein
VLTKPRRIWDSEQGVLSYGGTCSSFNLREALLLQIEIESHKDHPDYSSLKESILKMIERWRSALRRHNAQAFKGIEFNVETGKPKNGKV